MAMSHAGDAGHVPLGGDRRAFILLGLLTGLYFVVELGVDPWSGWVAVTSDAFHTISAVGGVLIALVAQRLSERLASAESSSGWGRAEIVGALFNGVFLVIMAGYVFSMGAMRHAEPIELATTVLLYTAFGGIVIELIAFWLLNECQKDNLNIKGAFWHIIQAFIGSLIIIVSTLVIGFTRLLAIDPILGMAFGVALFWASWTIVRSALRILLQSTPEDLTLRLRSRLWKEEGVKDVHHVHAWSVTSGRNLFFRTSVRREFAGDAGRARRASGSNSCSRFISRRLRSRKTAFQAKRAPRPSTSPVAAVQWTTPRTSTRRAQHAFA